MVNHFNFYAWNKAGRPASPAKGSDAYQTRRHWKFNTPDDYWMLDESINTVYIRGGGFFEVAEEFRI